MPHELPGQLGIVAVLGLEARFQGGIVAFVALYHRVAGMQGVTAARKQHLQHFLAIDGAVDRLADAHVVPGELLPAAIVVRLAVEPVEDEVGLDGWQRGLGRGHPRRQGLGHQLPRDVGDVGFFRQQHRELGGRFGHEADFELLELGNLPRVVVLEALVQDPAGLPGNELEVSRAREAAVVALEALLVELLLAVDLHDGMSAVQVQQVGARLLVVEAHRVLVQDLHLRAAQLIRGRNDRVVARAQVVAVHDVLGRELAITVVKLDALSQVKGPLREVVIVFPRGGEPIAVVFTRHRVVRHQPFQGLAERVPEARGRPGTVGFAAGRGQGGDHAIGRLGHWRSTPRRYPQGQRDDGGRAGRATTPVAHSI